MSTDYTPAITAVITLVALFSGMVGFILSRPSDLSPSESR